MDKRHISRYVAHSARLFFFEYIAMYTPYQLNLFSTCFKPLDTCPLLFFGRVLLFGPRPVLVGDNRRDRTLHSRRLPRLRTSLVPKFAVKSSPPYIGKFSAHV